MSAEAARPGVSFGFGKGQWSAGGLCPDQPGDQITDRPVSIVTIVRTMARMLRILSPKRLVRFRAIDDRTALAEAKILPRANDRIMRCGPGRASQPRSQTQGKPETSLGANRQFQFTILREVSRYPAHGRLLPVLVMASCEKTS